MDKQIKNWPVQLKFTAKFMALGCFTIGTLLFTSYLTHPNDTALMYGFYFVSASAIINTILLLGLITMALVWRRHYKELLKGAGILLLNVPITILYFNILF